MFQGQNSSFIPELRTLQSVLHTLLSGNTFFGGKFCHRPQEQQSQLCSQFLCPNKNAFCCKGTLTEFVEDRVDPTSYSFSASCCINIASAYLTDARYFATSGQDQLFSLHSKHALLPNTWTHVAVVQAKSRYVGGKQM